MAQSQYPIWQSQGIRVEVVVEGRSMPLYRDPDSQDSEQAPADALCSTRYVEAVTGARFTLRVTLLEEFDLRGSDGLEFLTTCDGGPCWSRYIFRQCQKCGKNHSIDQLGHPQYHPEIQGWKYGHFSFGPLDLQESEENVLRPWQAKHLGLIEVLFRRCKLTSPPEALPTYFSPQSQQTISETSEKALKGKAISNTVKMLPGAIIDPPRKSTLISTPLVGRDGALICFKVLYRSRHNLQILGCIPRTPSPEPVASSSSSSSGASARNTSHTDPTDEIQALRNRLAFLERDLLIKPEPSTGTAVHATLSDPRSTLKRDHPDNDPTTDRKRPRVSQPIDLTTM